jgi:acetyl esterase/lipase
VDPVKHSLTYYAALQKASVPAETHLYAQGGHAFGVGPTKLPIGGWPAVVEQSLHHRRASPSAERGHPFSRMTTQ